MQCNLYIHKKVILKKVQTKMLVDRSSCRLFKTKFCRRHIFKTIRQMLQ